MNIRIPESFWRIYGHLLNIADILVNREIAFLGEEKIARRFSDNLRVEFFDYFFKE